jgi:hypothetical protein
MSSLPIAPFASECTLRVRQEPTRWVGPAPSYIGDWRHEFPLYLHRGCEGEVQRLRYLEVESEPVQGLLNKLLLGKHTCTKEYLLGFGSVCIACGTKGTYFHGSEAQMELNSNDVLTKYVSPQERSLLSIGYLSIPNTLIDKGTHYEVMGGIGPVQSIDLGMWRHPAWKTFVKARLNEK